MTEGKFFSTTDIIGIIVCFIVIVGLGFLYQSNTIDLNAVTIGMLMILLFALGRNAIPTIIAAQFVKQLEGKSMEDHWQQAKKQINETNNKYSFGYNYQLPEYYMPKNCIEIEELGLVLFEINRDDFKGTINENEATTLFQYPIITVILKTSNGKIKATMRGMNIDQTIDFINKNIQFYKPSNNQIILPEQIEKITWGQPIATTRPTTTEAKK